MISHEHRLVITNVFRRMGWGILIGAAWMIGIELLGIIGEFLIDHRLDSLLVSLQGIPGLLPFIFNCILGGYFLITAYSDFKWTIQNGISRRTLWWGRFIALILSTIGIWVIDELIALLNHPVASWRAMGMQFLIFLTVILTTMMIGNGFGLLNRRWKWIVGIGLPILLIIILAGLVRIMVGLNFGYQYNAWVGPHGIVLNILGSSLTWWTIWIVYLVIVIFLAKFFNDRLQLRRD